MSDMIRQEQGDAYARYEKRLLERDALKKEAGSILTAYIREFGDLISRIFRKKIDCIAKKKTIAFCQSAVNRHQQISGNQLSSYLQEAMASYEARLAQMLREYRQAKAAEVSSEYTVLRCKKIYRRIARLIHPDMNPGAWRYEQIPALWDRTAAAYSANDPEELQNVEVLVHKVLEENGYAPGALNIENIEERIQTLEEEIEKIRTTDPYLYRLILEDPAAAAQKKEDLQAELEAYEKYAGELRKVIIEFVRKGIVIEWEEN